MDTSQGYCPGIISRDTTQGYHSGIQHRDTTQGYHSGIPHRDTAQGYHTGIPLVVCLSIEDALALVVNKGDRRRAFSTVEEELGSPGFNRLFPLMPKKGRQFDLVGHSVYLFDTMEV